MWKLEKRRLGTSNLYVSEVGLGCMSLGTDEEKARSIIDEAIDLGINYFDTADLYQYGLNEEFIGKAMKSRRQEMILATKVGNRFEQGKEGWDWDPSKKYIKEAVKNSLRRLQTDYIDLYQLHGGTVEDNIEETIEAFEELTKEGVIRYYGISSIRPNVIKKYLEHSNIVSIMMQFSLLDRRPEEWFEFIQKHHVSVIARGPLAKGLLTDRPLSQASEKIKENGYLHYSFTDLQETLEQIDKACPTHTRNEIALQYCLSHNVVGAVIPGASMVHQVRANVQAAKSQPLTQEEIHTLKQMTKRSIYTNYRE